MMPDLLMYELHVSKDTHLSRSLHMFQVQSAFHTYENDLTHLKTSYQVLITQCEAIRALSCHPISETHQLTIQQAIPGSGRKTNRAEKA